jgi:hypothetical protein
MARLALWLVLRRKANALDRPDHEICSRRCACNRVMARGPGATMIQWYYL